MQIIKTTLLTMALMLIASLGMAQSGSGSLPKVTLHTLDGLSINAETIENDGKPIIISFWATWCKPCIKELKAIHESYVDWQDETGVKLIAISIDDERSASRVGSMVAGFGWDYDVYIDKNSDFKRAMNVVNVPHTFLLDGDLNIVSQHTSYAPGNEEELYDEVLELVEGGE